MKTKTKEKEKKSTSFDSQEISRSEDLKRTTCEAWSTKSHLHPTSLKRGFPSSPPLFFSLNKDAFRVPKISARRECQILHEDSKKWEWMNGGKEEGNPGEPVTLTWKLYQCQSPQKRQSGKFPPSKFINSHSGRESTIHFSFSAILNSGSGRNSQMVPLKFLSHGGRRLQGHFLSNLCDCAFDELISIIGTGR